MDSRRVERVRVAGLPDPAAGAVLLTNHMPSQAARPTFDVIELPRPAHPDASREIAIANLLLPERFAPTLPEAMSGGFDTTTAGLWRPHRSGLSVPVTVADELEWREAWRAQTYVTPSSIGLDVGAERAEAVAWAALSLMPLDRVAYYVAGLASRCEPVGAPAHRQLAARMTLPEQLGPAVRGAVGTDGVLFDSRCLRWVVCELAAARALPTPPRPPLDSEGEALLRWWFPMARTGLAVSPEVLRALFLLHDGYEVGGRIVAPEDHHDLVLALTSAYSHGIRFHSTPDDRLARWHQLWTLDDGHPLLSGLARGTVPPSRFRQIFRARTGLDVDDWFVVCTMLTLVHRARMGGVDTAPVDRLLHALPTELVRRVTSELRFWLSTDLRQLGRAVARSPSYAGLGTVPRHTTDVLAARPLLRARSGELMPLGLGLLTDRISALPMTVTLGVLGPRRRDVRSHLGPMVEARTHDLLQPLEGRHWVINDLVLSQLFAREPHADAVVAKDFDYLVIELYGGELQEPHSAGNVGVVKSLCQLYQGKADQARHIVNNIERVARHRGLQRVDWAGFIVVVEEPLRHSPALSRELASLRPEEPTKFVVSVDEFEHAVALAERGWELPQLVRRWQDDGTNQAFGVFLEQYERLTSVAQRRRDRPSDPLVRALERLLPEAS